MRRTNEPKWVFDKGGTLAGIALGSDFCAEHEWGVKSMKKLLGCDESLDGIERRVIREIPPELRRFTGSFQESKKLSYTAIFLSGVQSFYAQPPELVKRDLTPYREATLTAAWDEKSFGVAAWDDKNKKHMETLWDAFQKKDIAFWTNVGPFHLGGGLIFAIVSRVPQENKDEMLAADLDYKKLLQAAEDTGIAKKLEAAGKKWFALTPKWVKGFKDFKTKHPVVFWLNPYEQNRNHSNWFSVEDLELWAEDKGPIVKTPEFLKKQEEQRRKDQERERRGRW